MGFSKLGFFFLVLLFQLHLLSTQKIISQGKFLVTEQKVRPRFQQKSAVSRRGGGGSSGHGGEMGSEGAHGGNGDKSPQTQGGGAVIPLYAAGAAGGGDPHRNDNHHHGSSHASPRYIGLNYLLCSILMSLAFV